MDFQTAIVTGGTGLIGRALVHHLLGQGVKVGVPYRDENRYRLFRGGVTEGGLLFGKPCDLTKSDQADQFVDWFRDRVQAPIEVLVCGTGSFLRRKLGDTSADQWNEVIATNLTATFNVCRAVVPEMAVRNWGKVITIGAPPGLNPGHAKSEVAFAAAKAGLVAYTQALAAEVWHQDVKVNMVVPSEVIPTADAGKKPGVTPEDVVKVIRALLSKDSEAISGAVVKVYGSKYDV
ncbi:MAG: SDR family oxidoreductase [Planctomycetota bacterium]